jgi:2,3-bisphosphoglycerate-independent phosphoglycerate mutase
MNILFIFFDGWGLGVPDPRVNPLLIAPMPTLRELFDGTMPTNNNGHYVSARATLVPTDATLGVPGLPQSATGQTTIFTGINAPRAIGEHSGPYPNPALREILAHDNLFMRLTQAKHKVAFANAYPPIFFERLARNTARRSATSHAVSAANVRYRTIDDLRQGDAVSVFVTNRLWVAHGANVPLITARDAGRNLARIAQANDLTVFEYFLTDAAGHRARPDFTLEILDELDLSDSLVITTSDHGNIEDSTAKSHNLNPVPTLLIGAGRERLAPRIHSLTDLTPAIIDLMLGK